MVYSHLHVFVSLLNILTNLQTLIQYTLTTTQRILHLSVKNKMGGACSTYGGRVGGEYRVLVGKHEGNRPL